jgi:hypothetical protein
MGKRKAAVAVEGLQKVPDRNLGAGHGWCQRHSKQCFVSKRWAKLAIRRINGVRMSAYRCDAVDGVWHIGHMSALVTEGVVSRDDWRDSGVRATPRLLADPVRAREVVARELARRAARRAVSPKEDNGVGWGND